jgi:hypothetical protein
MVVPVREPERVHADDANAVCAIAHGRAHGAEGWAFAAR